MMELLNKNKYKLGDIVEDKIVVCIRCAGEWYYGYSEELELEEIVRNHRSRIGEELKNGNVIIGEMIEEGEIVYSVGIKEHFERSSVDDPFLTSHSYWYSSIMLEDL